MTITRGNRVRLFVSLISLIFFIVLLRTHTNSGFSSPHATQESNTELPSLTALETTGEERFLRTGRHVLNLQTAPNFVTVTSTNATSVPRTTKTITRPCENVRDHVGFPDACSYVRANTECHSGTVIEYITAFYCTFSKAPTLASILYTVWLLMLFYMLGNTAADYFCCSLEKLSDLLRLPPTVAGVSLLPLGNGAPDVFASIAAFMGTGHIQVGLNSVLGGAVFVTSVVAGFVSLAVQPTCAQLDCICFVRDVGFFLVSLAVLSLIIYSGKIHLFGAVGYLSIYVLYGITVAVYELMKKRSSKKHSLHLDPIHSNGSSDATDDLPSPLDIPNNHWDRHVAIYSHSSQASALTMPESHRDYSPLERSPELEEAGCRKVWSQLWQALDLLLGLPRRLTIPVVEEERWSRPFAIASAALAPALLAGVWDSNDGHPFGSSRSVYMFGAGVGITLGLLAYFTIDKEVTPRWSLPWVIGGFTMSIVWFYLIANELVAALVALGVILGIDSAVLGLTLLAWGNSIGDLISNLALCKRDGVQIAISGCYAGPMFNTLVGLGLSFVLASWKRYPQPLVLPEDNTLIYTIGFLFLSLLWALLVLPAGGMAPSKFMGNGLLFLYAAFMSLRLANSLGLISLDGFHLGSARGFLGVRML